MSEHIVIHGEHSGDWCLIFGQLRPTDPVRPTLYGPRYWTAPGRYIGLSYSPGMGINLSRNPRRAHKQAQRIVAKVERKHRRRIRKAARQRDAIANIKETA